MAIQLIIDGSKDGLPDAVPYYRTFPREPSPLGDITLSAQNTSVMTNTSLDAAFDEMNKAGSGGVVVLVCHAFRQGLLMTLAPKGKNAFAEVTNLGTLDQVIMAESETSNIRKLPTTTSQEQQAILDRWKTLLNKLQPGAVTGSFTTQEAEAFYAKWVAMVAKKLEFGAPAKLRTFLAKVSKIRAQKISRLELRACNIGDNQSTMETVRKFFGADHLTAPIVGTFFVGALPVSTMSHSRILGQVTGVHAQRRTANPLGLRAWQDNLLSAMLLAQSGHTSRGFLRKTIVPLEFSPARGRTSVMHLGAITSYFAFVLTIDETQAFHYRASAAVSRAKSTGAEDWAIVRNFVTGWIMPGSSYTSGAFPIAGLWTPDIEGQPFTLPNETSYTKLIAQTP